MRRRDETLKILNRSLDAQLRHAESLQRRGLYDSCKKVMTNAEQIYGLIIAREVQLAKED